MRRYSPSVEKGCWESGVAGDTVQLAWPYYLRQGPPDTEAWGVCAQSLRAEPPSQSRRAQNQVLFPEIYWKHNTN